VTDLALYDAARAALAAAVRVDEVRDVLAGAAAIRAYAQQAKDREMEANAVVLRERAERRLGEMLVAQRDSGGLARGGRPAKPVPDAEQVSMPEITLADMGIDRKLSSRAQRKAGIALQAFEAMVEGVRDRIIAGHGSDTLKAVTTADKQAHRAARERALGAMQCALPDKKYGVILADPEWRFEPWSRETGLDRAADNHYPTSCTEVIAARDVPAIAARDCVLFLWATVPMLPHALLVMAAWGFDYRSHCVWSKVRPTGEPAIGTGYWFRNCHEILLVGVSGDIPAPAPGEQEISLLEAAIGTHSEKPEEFYRLIEDYFPTLPKIELNARRARPGWDAWGNEAPATDLHESDAQVIAPNAPHAVLSPETSSVPDPDDMVEIPRFLRGNEGARA
jgi:N6-adenosine-specific RNA methylase IME4